MLNVYFCRYNVYFWENSRRFYDFRNFFFLLGGGLGTLWVGGGPRRVFRKYLLYVILRVAILAHQNRTIAIASDFRVDGSKSPEIQQEEGVSGVKIAARNRKSLATLHRTLKIAMQHCFVLSGNR